MNKVWIIFVGLMQLLLIPCLCKRIIINGSNLRSFTCLGVNSTDENCRVLGRVASLPEKLLKIYREQTLKVQNALDAGDVTILNEYELASIHPSLLLLIPKNELSQVGGDKLAFLVEHWSNDKVIIRHLLSATQLYNNMDKFIHKVRTTALKDEILDLIGESLSLDRDPILMAPLLIHLPLYQISNITSEQRSRVMVFLKLTINNMIHWRTKKPIIQRIWSKLLIEEEFPKPLNQWTDLDVNKVGPILIGIKPTELCQIDEENLVDKNYLLNMGFNTLQIRVLFSHLYKNNDITAIDVQHLKNIFIRLLPTHIQKLSNKITYFSSLANSPPVKSLATTKQIIVFLQREVKHKFPPFNGNKLPSVLDIGIMVHSLPLTNLSVYKDSPLSLDQLLPLQSDYLTSTQVYYLLGMGTELDPTNKRFTEATTYLHALPTNRIPIKLNSSLTHHLALHLPTDNLPRLMKFLHYSLPYIGESKVIMNILQTPDRLKIFNYLPTRLLMKELKNIPEYIEELSNELNPSSFAQLNKMASSLYRSLNENLANSAKGTDSLINPFLYGFNCQDMAQLSTPDFIIVVTKLRQAMQIAKQEFPKELQHCTTKKLFEYLRLKSFFRQMFIDDNLISLLSPVEIEAVGGWILSSLPLEEITRSKYLKEIVQQIGFMSATEILATAPLEKLKSIIYHFLALQKSTNIKIRELSLLGNMTMIMTENLIEKIDYEAFKVLLEGSFFDTKICATSSQRNAWTKLITQAFGPSYGWTGEELKILENMLIILPRKDLEDIPIDAWIQVVDILEIGYFHRVQWYKRDTFLEVCQSILPLSEAESYTTSIKTVIRFLLRAAQMQLNTVKSGEELWPDSVAEFGKPTIKDVHNIEEPSKTKGQDDDIQSSEKDSVSNSASESEIILVKDARSVEEPSETKGNTYDIQSTEKGSVSNSVLESGKTPIKDMLTLEESSEKKGIVQSIEKDSALTQTEFVVTANTNYNENYSNIDLSMSNSSFFREEEKEQNDSYDNSKQNSDKIEMITENKDHYLDVKDYIKLSQSNGSDIKYHWYNNTDNIVNIQQDESSDLSNNRGIKKIYNEVNPTSITPTDYISTSEYSNTSNKTKTSISYNYDEKIDNTNYYYDTSTEFFETEGKGNENLFTNTTEKGQQTADSLQQPLTNTSNYSNPDKLFRDETKKSVIQPVKLSPGISKSLESELHSISPRENMDLNIYANSTEAFHAFEDDRIKGHNQVNNFNEDDDLLHPATHSKNEDETFPHHLLSSSDKLGTTVIQPLKIPLEIPSRSIEKLQDVLPQEIYDTKIYANLQEALHFFENVHQQEYQVDEDDDILRPSTSLKVALEENKNIDNDFTQQSSELIQPVTNFEVRNGKITEKRSIKPIILHKVTCDAMKIIGKPIELILSKDMIDNLSDEELFNCMELFATIKLPETLQRLIWSHLKKTDTHLKRRLVAVAEVEDLNFINFNTSISWALETVFTFSKFNNKMFVGKHILNKAFEQKDKISVEETTALGKLVCYLPNLEDILRPSVLFKSSVILGSSLPCNHTCLKTLAVIASKKEAFGPSAEWSSFDVSDLGIIIAGLDLDNWKYLMETKSDVLYGLQTVAGECLSTHHIEAIPRGFIEKIPYFTRVAIQEKLNLNSTSQEINMAFTLDDDIELQDNFFIASKSLNIYLNSVLIIINFIVYYIFNHIFSS